MRKLILISMTLMVFQLTFGQSLSPLNPTLGGIDGIGLVDDEQKIRFNVAPAKNADEASLIWSNGQRFNFLNNASINGTSESGSAYVDLISDYLGPIRVALSTSVAATDRSQGTEEDDNIERFLSGGGAAILNFTFIGPTLSWNEDKSYLTLLANPKVGFDFPALGLSTDENTINVDLGIDLKFNTPLYQNNIGFTGNYRLGYVAGGNSFYEDIGLIDDDANPFVYSQVSFGITLPGINWAILWNKTISGPKSLSSFHENGRISLVISPKK